MSSILHYESDLLRYRRVPSELSSAFYSSKISVTHSYASHITFSTARDQNPPKIGPQLNSSGMGVGSSSPEHGAAPRGHTKTLNHVLSTIPLTASHHFLTPHLEQNGEIRIEPVPYPSFSLTPSPGIKCLPRHTLTTK